MEIKMKMKKTLGIAATLVIALSSHANIAINFGTTSSTLKDQLGANLVSHSTFAVYWSPDPTINFNSQNYQNSGAVGNDVYMGVFDTSGSAAAAGRITGNSSVPFAEPSGANSYIYIVVFNTAYNAGSPNIVAGTFYGVGPVLGGPGGPNLPLGDQTLPTPPPADLYSQVVNTTGGSIIQTLQQITAVPEPATFAFMGIGGLVLAIRRFRRA
jgi:hypothetical protein